jgi:hypothetical protein
MSAIAISQQLSLRLLPESNFHDGAIQLMRAVFDEVVWTKE